MVANEFHQLRDTIGINFILLEVTKNSGNAVERTLLVVELQPRGMTDNLPISTLAIVLGEYVDLRNRFPRMLWYVQNLFQRPIIIEQVRRVEETNRCQFLQYPRLLGVRFLAQCAATFLQVRLDVRQAHQLVGAAIHLLHTVAGIPSSHIRLATILIWVSQQMIAETPLLGGQTILIG